MSTAEKFVDTIGERLKLFDAVKRASMDMLLFESGTEQFRMPVGYIKKFSVRIRNDCILKMERLLFIWIADLKQKRMSYMEKNIEVKAVSLYTDLIVIDEDEEIPLSPLLFYKGLNTRLKRDFGVHSRRLFVNCDSPDKNAAAKYSEELSTIIQKGNYKPEQIFNVDDTSFFWKKLPSHANLVSEENSCYGTEYSKASNEQLTILLGGNAAGDFKLKPTIVCPSHNADAFNELSSETDLPVFANMMAWFTKTKFEEWFINYFCPATKHYCQEKGLDHNILLILDNAPAHQLNMINDNVQVTYIPPNTAPLLQPVDQGIFPIFKANYIHHIFSEAVKETSAENGPSLVEYWKNYNIKNAVANIASAWNEVTSSQMRGVWKHILPQSGNTNDDFNVNSHLIEVAKSIVELGHKLGFDEEFDTENVLECINWNTAEVDNDHLIYMMINRENKGPSELTIPQLEKIIANTEKLTDYIKIDPNKERSASVANAMNKSIRSYKDEYEQKKKERSKKKRLQ